MADRSRVLVTGGAGFIGRRVVRALLAEGHEVTVADRRAFPDPEVRSVTGDLRDPGVPERAVRDVMGWSNSAMVKRYAHVTARLRRDIADRLNSFFWTGK